MDAPLIPDAAPLGVQWITCPQFRDERGVLSVAEHNELPFVPQRTFWITSVPPEAQRGGHAHRTTHELLGALHGSCQLELQIPSPKIVVTLDSSSQFIHIPAMVWARLYDFSPEFVGLCFTSESYKADGYLHTFDEYLKAYRVIKHNSIQHYF